METKPIYPHFITFYKIRISPLIFFFFSQPRLLLPFLIILFYLSPGRKQVGISLFYYFYGIQTSTLIFTLDGAFLVFFFFFFFGPSLKKNLSIDIHAIHGLEIRWYILILSLLRESNFTPYFRPEIMNLSNFLSNSLKCICRFFFTQSPD